VTSFTVHGPIDLAYEKRKGGRTLVFDSFWDDESAGAHLANERGCYVFAVRNRALTPIYIGQATKNFKQETFNPANRHKYHDGFSDYAKGSPVMYFVVHPTQKGRLNAKQITEIEDFLIQSGVAKNPDLQNVRGSQKPKWSIKGVIRGTRGKKSKAEKDFSKLFDIHE
jgi:hypothetical protein